MNCDDKTPALYRSKFIHATLYGWVTARRANGQEIKQAIKEYQSYMNLTHIPYPTLYMAYFRMCKKWIDCRRVDSQYKQADLDLTTIYNTNTE